MKNYQIIKENDEIFEELYYIKNADGMEYGPYFEILPFDDCELFMGLNSHNDDADVFDENGKIIYNDDLDNWQRVQAKFNKFLSVGREIGQINSILKQEMSLLSNKSVKKAIFSVFDKHCAKEIESAKDEKSKTLYTIMHNSERKCLANKFEKIEREYKNSQKEIVK